MSHMIGHGMPEWVEELNICLLEAYACGREPNIVCLGKAQRQQYYDVLREAESLDWSDFIFGLRMIWTTDEDCVVVYEEKKFSWV
jgi:hypothetical protein